ncbi:MAG TPA: hypothetical protein VGC20_16160 [bacterium]|jgi:hypothetical protein
MSETEASIHVEELDGHAIRTTQIDGTEFVAVQDFCAAIQGLVNRVVEVTRRQQDQLAAMNVTIDVLYDVLSTNHPELEEELLKVAQQRRRPA